MGELTNPRFPSCLSNPQRSSDNLDGNVFLKIHMTMKMGNVLSLGREYPLFPSFSFPKYDVKNPIWGRADEVGGVRQTLFTRQQTVVSPSDASCFALSMLDPVSIHVYYRMQSQ